MVCWREHGECIVSIGQGKCMAGMQHECAEEPWEEGLETAARNSQLKCANKLFVSCGISELADPIATCTCPNMLSSLFNAG